ncbi:MAG: dihydroorotate dehydrogenase electron transfer subunit [Clostridiaceae bacterium]|jgi:dihydroorotate dehydrogenase electron transfer subunit|nr:dihydroorotate dehydrogenase electron transfer subunit [Clostridiaceae bacterium]
MDYKTTITQNRRVANGVFKLTLSVGALPEILPGQFAQVKLPDGSALLRRPFCIADFDRAAGTVTLLYAVKGKGTEALSALTKGGKLDVLLPLGNGFKFDASQRKIMLIGGGMGAAVLPAFPSAYPDKEFYTFLGFANKKAVICADLKDKSRFALITTDDGSNGERGFVTDKALAEMSALKPDSIAACGPVPMYRSMQKSFAGVSAPVYVSLEERMGCGFGACLVCACKIKSGGNESYKRVCKDGPVFLLNEVCL